MGRKEILKTESKFKQVIEQYGISGAKIASVLGITQGGFARKLNVGYSQSFSKEEEVKIEKYLKRLQKDISAAL